MLERLVSSGVLYPMGGAPRRYLPARAPEIIPLQALLDLAWDGGEEVAVSLPADGGVSDLMGRLNAAQTQALAGLSLKDLLARDERNACAETALSQLHYQARVRGPQPLPDAHPLSDVCRRGSPADPCSPAPHP